MLILCLHQRHWKCRVEHLASATCTLKYRVWFCFDEKYEKKLCLCSLWLWHRDCRTIEDQISHHSVLAPVGQAVVHCDLLSLCNISDCDDHQPYLGPTVDFSYTTVWRRMEEDRSSNSACSFLSQLWHTEGLEKCILITAHQSEQDFHGDGLLTRAE